MFAELEREVWKKKKKKIVTLADTRGLSFFPLHHLTGTDGGDQRERCKRVIVTAKKDLIPIQ